MTAVMSQGLRDEVQKNSRESWAKARPGVVKMYAKLILNATYCSREEALSRAEDLVRRRFD